MGEKGIDYPLLVPEAGHNANVYVASKPGFAPMLNGEPADETESEAMPLKNPLKLRSFVDQVNHAATSAWPRLATRPAPMSHAAAAPARRCGTPL